MKKEMKSKSERTLIFKDVKNIIVFYTVLTIMGLCGSFFSQFVAVPFNYLLISPSFYNYAPLNWVAGAWGYVLSIHGTIAALTITFMGVFVQQTSTYSEYGFESICRVLLLRKNKFLKFSIESICGLLCGMVLFFSGSGVLSYVVSVLISLYFIVSYGFMYFRLYSVTENPSLFTDLLFSDLRSTGDQYNEILLKRESLKSDFEIYLSGKGNLLTDTDVYLYDSKVLNVFHGLNDKEISGFSSANFNLIDIEMGRLKKNSDLHLIFHVNFLSPTLSSYIELRFPKDAAVELSVISRLELLIKNAFVLSDEPYLYKNFESLENALITNIRNTLLTGNEWSLDFGVQALNVLSPEKNFANVLQKLDLSITSSNKKNVIDYHLLAQFFEKLSNSAIGKNNIDGSLIAMRSIIDLARYIYTPDYFYEFHSRISMLTESRARYPFYDDYRFLDLYISVTTQNLISKNYRSFEKNTKFLTREMNFLDDGDRDSLNEMQSKLMICMKEIVTLLIIRIDHVRKFPNADTDELFLLKGFIESWLNPVFLEEIYYKKETYDILFTIPDDFSMFNAERAMREIPDGSVARVSIKNDTYKAIALMLTKSEFNHNNLNLIFLRNVDELTNILNIKTHEIKYIIDFLQGGDYLSLIETIIGKVIKDSKHADVIMALEKILSEMKSMLITKIIKEDLQDKLVEKYKEDVLLAVEKYLDKAISLKNISCNEFVNGNIYSTLIDKREVLNSLDGVHYSMNPEHHGQAAVYEWVRELINKTKDCETSLIELKTVDELIDKKLITIQYKVSDRVNTYRYGKGIQLTDKEGFLDLGGAGLYYFDLSECFSLLKKEDIVDTSIIRTTNENIDALLNKFNIENQNPLLYAALNITINISAKLNSLFNVYFLSEERCKYLSELQSRELNQLTEMKGQSIQSDSSSQSS